ncbi:hypothetical protein D3C87_1291980 [compost metagenome]
MNSAVQAEGLPGFGGEHQVGRLRPAHLQDLQLPTLNILRRLVVRRAGRHRQRPGIGPRQGKGQRRIALKINHRGRKAFPHHRDGAGQQRLRRHPLETAVQHIDLVFNLKHHVDVTTLHRRKLTADALANLAANRFAQVRHPHIFDVRRRKLVGLVTTTLDQLPLHQRRAERRHATTANIHIDSHFFRIGLDDVGEELFQ